MGAPKYRAPLKPEVSKPAPEATKEDIEELNQKIKKELNQPDKLKILSHIITELMKS